MNLLLLAAIVGWVLAVGGWLAFWMREDQVTCLADERDHADDNAERWMRRALDAEAATALALGEIDRVEANAEWSLRLVVDELDGARS